MRVSHDSEAPAIGQQVITACAFIHARIDGVEKVFLPRRAATKRFLPGVYELPGGHIDFGENLVDGLAREIREEFGMGVQVGDPFAAFTYMNEIKGAHAVEVIFFARFTAPLERMQFNPDDHSGFRWFAEHELCDAVTDLKGLDDVEFLVMQKGFSLLKGRGLAF